MSNPSRSAWLVALVAAGLGVVVGRRGVANRLPRDLYGAFDPGTDAPVPTPVAIEARARADAVAAARRADDAVERGEHPGADIGLDLARLQAVSNELEPVVQYLTYIKSRRGQDSALLFIRYDDIDAMADIDGESSAQLLDRLDQLGVVISSN